jgi:acetyl-CoA carboxylase biotin carboxyl carrier protein
MFKFEEICELVKLVSSSKVATLEIEHAGTRLRIEGPPQASEDPAAGLRPAATAAVGAGEQPPTVTAAVPDAAPDEPINADDDHLHWVSSPIVGTFYRAPNPDSDPYVKVGDFVEQGQTLCIVEAMKLMNEIEADVSGTIVKVLPENSQPVEYGERLFAVRSN